VARVTEALTEEQHDQLTVVTHSVPVINTVTTWNDPHLVAMGSLYLPAYMVFVGPQATESLRSLSADVAIVGCDGLSLDEGLTTPHQLATHAGGHFTAKEFRTWNATVLMALLLANAGPSATGRQRKTAIAASVRGVAGWLGDTPTVARKSYVDPRLISHYETHGELSAVPVLPAALPVPAEAELAVARLLADA
jgi:hypothetical protein